MMRILQLRWIFSKNGSESRWASANETFQKQLIADHKQNWDGSLTFEKVVRYLPHFKSAIQIPIYVLGIDI